MYYFESVPSKVHLLKKGTSMHHFLDLPQPNFWILENCPEKSVIKITTAGHHHPCPIEFRQRVQEELVATTVGGEAKEGEERVLSGTHS